MKKTKKPKDLFFLIDKMINPEHKEKKDSKPKQKLKEANLR